MESREAGIDRLQLDATIWGDDGRSVAAVLGAATSDVLNQRVIFYFDQDTVLTLTGIGDAALLAGYLDLI